MQRKTTNNTIMKNGDYYVIGGRKDENGVTIFQAGETDNGYCYKDEQAIKEHNGICYIREAAFEDGELRLDSNNMEDEVENGDVVTWDSAYDKVCDLISGIHSELPDCAFPFNNKEFAEYVTENLLLEVDWCGFDMMLAEIDVEEEWEYFNEKKQREKHKQ